MLKPFINTMDFKSTLNVAHIYGSIAKSKEKNMQNTAIINHVRG
jgi:hypothetical protein